MGHRPHSGYATAANCKDEKGHIPLHYAAINGHLEVVKYFIVELHCDPMDKNSDDLTPLHFACGDGHLNIRPNKNLISISSERNTVTHHVRTSMAVHLFTMLVIMVSSTLLSISSERNTVTHHVRTIMAIHHFTRLVFLTTPTLYNICYRLVE